MKKIIVSILLSLFFIIISFIWYIWYDRSQALKFAYEYLNAEKNCDINFINKKIPSWISDSFWFVLFDYKYFEENSVGLLNDVKKQCREKIPKGISYTITIDESLFHILDWYWDWNFKVNYIPYPDRPSWSTYIHIMKNSSGEFIFGWTSGCKPWECGEI